ncbi:hypothetical protein DPEC_G00072010 [Dallia pectoralis]|uniref:Uncharacterized protein n=1 Tax=Dallia pectoralis TaxID=75939 RepID=A0ACC2H309_DALPE|nr:hypothetical protein DPEC_G00072010 [Dallia pectoralis]
MRDDVKIVNNIRSKALSHRQFKTLMDEMKAQYGDVLYHQEGKDQIITQLFDHVKALKKNYCCSEDISQQMQEI